jgi:thymidylate synthase (FAD)
MNFFHHRCCNRAQWEIRELAEEMYKLCIEAAPHLFRKAGPKCVHGPCPEGKMSCGKAKEVREHYASLHSNKE